MKALFQPLLLLAAASGLLAADPLTSSVKLTSPDKPATIQIYLTQGSVHVVPGDAQDTVTVRTDAEPEEKQQVRPDGLRVISSGSASFSLTEKDNVVQLDYGRHSGPAIPNADFTVTVPKNASVEIRNQLGGESTVEGLSGDVEIKNMQGAIRLKDLSGSVLVETMNGEISASLSALTPNKAVSFTSMNGRIEVSLPEDAKANVRFRTQNGAILTDFADTALKTKVEPREPGKARAAEVSRAAREAAREAGEIAREVVSEIREAMHDGNDGDDSTPRPPRAPKPPRSLSIPTVVGGKVVAGTLNGGGGGELQAATMNGDIVVRRRK